MYIYTELQSLLKTCEEKKTTTLLLTSTNSRKKVTYLLATESWWEWRILMRVENPERQSPLGSRPLNADHVLMALPLYLSSDLISSALIKRNHVTSVLIGQRCPLCV